MNYQIHTKGNFIRFSTKPSQALAAYEDKDGRSCIDIYPVDDIFNSYLKIWFNNDSLQIIAYDKRIDIILETNEKIVDEIRGALTKAGIEVAGGFKL